MRLLVIRHAIAEDRVEFARTGEDDARRPLTKKGRRRMRDAARGLRALVPSIDVLAASPLVRAQQTAAIVADAYGGLPVVTAAELAPRARPPALLRWLRARKGAEVVAVVGHEPHLSLLVSWLLTGGTDVRVELRKGGACLLDFGASVRAGGPTLRWLLQPGQLRAIGRGS